MSLIIEPGNLVKNPENPEWGFGQVQSVVKNKVTVNFENVGKLVIDIDIVTLLLIA